MLYNGDGKRGRQSEYRVTTGASEPVLWKNYHIAPLLEVIDKVINQLHSEFYWGYAPEYYLSAANQCTPSYASHFYNKHMLPIDQVGEMLEMIAPEKDFI